MDIGMEHGDDLTQQLRDAALAGDAALILQLERERDEQSAVVYARQCKELRDRIKALEQERTETTRERAALESMQKLAAHAWRDAMDKADQRSQDCNLLGLRLGSMDSRLLTINEDIKEKRAALASLIAGRIGG